jgi:subtilisin family serine protease
MNRHHFWLAISAVISGSVLPAYSAIVTTNPPPMEIVVCTKTADVSGLLTQYGLTPKFTYHLAFNGFAAPMDDATAGKLMQDSRVISVEHDAPVVPADQYIGAGFIRMGISNFPVAHIDGGDHRINVNVAVLDTGIQTNHPDLNGVTNVDFTESGNNGEDWNGHGTLVAGIIGALNNNIGVVGVAPGVNLFDLEGLGPINSNWTTILAAVEYILVNPQLNIEVVNCSFIGTTTAPYGAINLAFQELVNAGVVVVAAVGNSTLDIAGQDGVFGTDDDILPAALPQVMAVSAMNPTNDTIASFSNFSQIPRTNNFSFNPNSTNDVFSPGGAIDVAAPGVNILSTYTNSGYAFQSGTSLACPHVVGLVALYIAANGRPTNAAGVYAIRQAIINNSLPQSQWMPNGQPFNSVSNPTGDPDTNHEPLAMPSLNWVPPPFISGAGKVLDGFQVGFSAVPGYDYTVQSATALGSSILWTNLSTISGNGFVAPASVTDTNLNSSGFYRLSRQPSP